MARIDGGHEQLGRDQGWLVDEELEGYLNNNDIVEVRL
jgi:hypothetical protein